MCSPIPRTFALFVALASPAIAQPSFTGLGDLPGGAFASGAASISADGMTIVGAGTGADGTQACFWHDGSVFGLGDWPGGTFSSSARSVSGDGSMIVGTGNDASGVRPFLWHDAIMEDLGGPCAGYNRYNWVSVSRDGRVVVGHDIFGNGGPFQAWRWENGIRTCLPDLPEGRDDSAATAVNADGSRIAGRGSSSRSGGGLNEACDWIGGVPHGLDDLPGGDFHSNALGINGDGRVLVGLGSRGSYVNHEPCRWVDGVIQPLGLQPGAVAGAAFAVSDDGEIILGYSVFPDNSTEAFIWDSVHGTRGLRQAIGDWCIAEVEGWTLTSAGGITPDGQRIVGGGVNPDGEFEGWVADLPRPCSACDLAPPYRTLNIFDFLAFQTYFSSECAVADLAQPIGEFNVFDFLAFQTAFGNECP